MSFVQLDTTTQGDWKGKYGNEGYNVINDSSAFPSYVNVTPLSNQNYTWASSTTATRALQKAASTDRIAGCWYQFGSFSVDVNLTDGQSHQMALYALDWDNVPRTLRFDIVDASTNALFDSRTLSSFSQGQYLVWNVQGHIKINVSQIGGGNAVLSGLFFGGPRSASTSPGATASFVQLDTTTQGNWKNNYGSDGYNVINNSANYPAYAQVSPLSNQVYTWNSSTSATQALQKAASTDRIAACWYQSGSFSIDVNLTDGQSHRMALYALDWDNVPRSQQMDIVDANTNALLDSRTISAFSQGQYVVWNVQGHIKINITQLGGGNAVMSGLFFGGTVTSGSGSVSGSANTASFLQLDATTQGSWKGAYGSEGYLVINDTQSVPLYALVSAQSAQPYTWTSSTSATQALQKVAAGGDRIAACLYQSSVFSLDVNLTDGQTHRVALYALDWDNYPRTQRIDVVDASTNALLDSRTISNFSQGQYLVWNLKGHVKINLTNLAGANAVASGLFFGP